MLGQLLLTSAAAAAGLVLAVWVLSLRLHDASIIDVFRGLGFALIGWLCFGLDDAARGRRLALAAMATLWGLRLALHIARRNHGRPEDFRCAGRRERDGRRFWLTRLYRIYRVQAVLMWIVALPLAAASSDGAGNDLGPLDRIGVAVWFVGLAFETIGDLQLARFKAEPASGEQVMDRGPLALYPPPELLPTWSPGGGSGSSGSAPAVPGGRSWAPRSTR